MELINEDGLNDHLDNIEYCCTHGLAGTNDQIDEALEIGATEGQRQFLAYIVENHKYSQDKIDTIVLGQKLPSLDVNKSDWVVYTVDTFFGTRQMTGQVSNVNGDSITVDGVLVPKENVSKRLEVLPNVAPFESILYAAQNAERGSAKLLAETMSGKIVYDNSDNVWYFFNGIFYEKDRTKRIKNTTVDTLLSQYTEAMSTVIKRYPSTKNGPSEETQAVLKAIQHLNYRNKINNIIDLATNEQELIVTGEVWNTNPYLLGCKNEIIDLRSGVGRIGNPDDYVSDVCPTLWQGLDCPAPRFEQFMNEIFANDKEKIAFVQRLMGYSLIGEQLEHIVGIFCGEDGRNGKSVFLGILRHVLGPYMTPGSEEILLSGKTNPGAATPYLTMLQGKRIVFVSETNEGAQLNSGVVKTLTGGDEIIARKLYGEAYSFHPTHTVFLITNHKPHASSEDEALWERVVLIEFTQRFVDNPTEPNEHKKDAYLMRKLKKEASGILAWLVQGCLDWHKQGLNPPASVKIATETYRQSEDTLGQFMDDCCVMVEGQKVQAKHFYETYSNWCKDGNIKPMRITTFGKRMKKRIKSGRERSGNFYYDILVKMPEIDEAKKLLESRK